MQGDGLPRVSVIIPVYNRARSVTESIQSVRSQNVQDWEIVAVDDGSKDGSVSVLESLSKQDTRIRVLSKRNGGAQSARNLGIREAKAPWIAFLDSDDQFLPGSLESRLMKAEQEKVSVVCSSCLRINEDGSQSIYSDPLEGNAYPALLKAPTVTFPGILASKKSLVAMGYLDESIVAYQEWDTAIRLAKNNRFAFVKEPTFRYDCRGGDTMSKQFRKAGVGYEQIVSKNYWPMLWIAGPTAMANHYRTIADWYHKSGDVVLQKKALRRAFAVKYLNPLVYVRKLVKPFLRVA